MFKKVILLIVFIGCTSSSFAQEIRSIHSLKSDFIGLGYGFELPFSPNAALNVELNLSSTFVGGAFIDEGLNIVPSFRMEPRFYYNYKRRVRKQKPTENNCADYLSLSAEYISGFNFLSENEGQTVISFIPKWGMRRPLSDHFYFELAGGIGQYISSDEHWKTTFDIDIRLAYVIN